MKNIARALGLLCGIATACFTQSAALAAPADVLPAGPLRIIVPVGPGSGTDALGRYLAERLGKTIGRPVVVENRPGGDTTVAVVNMLSAPADGSTLMLMSAATLVLNPLLSKGLPYEPKRDLRPIASAAKTTVLMVVGADSPFKTFDDVAAAARGKPQAVSVGGYSLALEVGMALVEQGTGVQFNYIPYKGSGPVLADLVGGTLNVGMIDVASALPMLRAGKIRALAITDKARHPDVPQTPTLKDLGLPVEYKPWIAVGVNAKTPEPVANALEAALLKVMAEPDYQAFLTRAGNLLAMPGPGKDVLTQMREETARLAPLVKSGRLAQR